MASYLWYLILYLGPALANNIIIETSEVPHKKPKNGIIDFIIEGLIEKEWDEDTKPCLNAMLLTLQNAKNSTLWAAWILDSIQLPTAHLYGSQYHLSNYDQCMNAPWKSARHGVPTKYCLSDIKLPSSSKVEDVHSDPYNSVKTYIETRTKLHLRDFSKMTFGICVPKVCNARAVSDILRVLLHLSQLSSVADDASISVESCEDPDTPTEYTFGNEGTKKIYSIKSLQFCDGFDVRSKLTAQTVTQDLGRRFTILVLFMTALFSTIYLQYTEDNVGSSSSFLQDLAGTFCIERNTKALTSIKDNEIHIINFIRVAGAITGVSTHVTLFADPYARHTGMNYEKLIDSAGILIEHVDIILNTNIALSGMLLMRSLMSKNSNPYKLIWKRYIRLIGLMAVLIFYIITWSVHVGDGPLWMKYAKPEQEKCINNGWLIFLMVHNYVNTENLCLVPSWHVSCDYLLTLFGIFLYVIYKKNKRIGTTLFITAFLASFLYPGIVTYRNKISATAFFGIDSLIDLRKNIVFLTNYAQSHMRAASFLIGMATGYFLVNYKPSEHRNVLSKKWSIAGFSLAFYAMFYVSSLADYHFRVKNPVEVALYAATNGVVWAASICAIIAISEYGTLPYLNSFFKWSPLAPLSRLTYGVNMMHVLFIQRVLYSTRNLYTDDLVEVFVNGYGYAVISFVFSYFLWLTVEAPLVNITNLLFDPKNKEGGNSKIEGKDQKETKTKEH